MISCHFPGLALLPKWLENPAGIGRGENRSLDPDSPPQIPILTLLSALEICVGPCLVLPDPASVGPDDMIWVEFPLEESRLLWWEKFPTDKVVLLVMSHQF